MSDLVVGHSIGPFVIGEMIANHTLFAELKETSDFKYEWGDVNLRTNKDGVINLISTKHGSYGEIATGKTFREVIENGYVLLYDEFDQVFYLKEPAGLCIEKKYENLTLTELLNSEIECLSVFKADDFYLTFCKDFEEIKIENLLEFEKSARESETFLKSKLEEFDSAQKKQTKTWWKFW